ncbi:MAG: HAD-IC family P-type ATPase [Patescibacteria group bacterium]|jgi:Ca2+-transporting ATPase
MRYPGLKAQEVKDLRFQFGANVLPAERVASGLRIFLAQFTNPLVYILLGVGGISLAIREYRDAGFILLTVVLNSVFGFVQEYKAQKTLTALKRMVQPTAKVIRDGVRQEIVASELVPGDIVFLTVGDRVPADAAVLEAASFFADESFLTGESEPVAKRAGDEVYMGSVISWGTATIRISKIGSATKIGEIAASIKETVQPPTTLQVRLEKYTRTLIAIAVGISILLFIIGSATGVGPAQMFRVSTVLLIAMIPEALLMAVTLILAIAMQKILKRKALIRKLLAVETLGSVTTICTDKTGTLTEGKMRVTEAEFVDRQSGLDVICLCNNISDATEIALWDYLARQENFDPQATYDRSPRILEIPFNSEHKFMAAANCAAASTECSLSVKGAPEVVLAMTELAAEEQAVILKKVEKWGGEGLRVLALARRALAREELDSVAVGSMPTLKFIGLVGLWDPPRQEVKEALRTAREAGIKIKVITGDYRHTAVKIMDHLGLAIGPNGLLEGREIDGLSDEALRSRVTEAVLFTRVMPRHKLRIVNALQSLGEIVAMTGDGVNDAPALKKANIGIVVGTASEVAKETADVILLDSNFKTIVAAVEEGRVVFENIRKAIFYMLANSFSAVMITSGAIIFGWPMPLSVAQILWIHLICDGPQDITLGLEPKEEEILGEGPKRLSEPILDRTRLFLIFSTSFLSAAFALSLFWYFGLRLADMELGRTMALTAATLGSILFIIPSRSFRKPFWRYGNFWKNPWLLAAVAINLTLQIVVTYVPYTRNFLKLAPLGAAHWGLLFLGIAAMIMFIEAVKWWQQKHGLRLRTGRAGSAVV